MLRVFAKDPHRGQTCSNLSNNWVIQVSLVYLLLKGPWDTWLHFLTLEALISPYWGLRYSAYIPFLSLLCSATRKSFSRDHSWKNQESEFSQHSGPDFTSAAVTEGICCDETSWHGLPWYTVLLCKLNGIKYKNSCLNL